MPEIAHIVPGLPFRVQRVRFRISKYGLKEVEGDCGFFALGLTHTHTHRERESERESESEREIARAREREICLT